MTIEENVINALAWIGRKVWCITDRKRRFHPYIVQGVVEHLSVFPHKAIVYVSPVLDEEGQSAWGGGTFNLASLGKAVFLTEEEAEVALQGGVWRD